MKVQMLLSGLMCGLLSVAVYAGETEKQKKAQAPVKPEKYRIVLIGPPASGKGTQAKNLSEKLDIPTISTGNLLRKAVQSGHPLAKSMSLGNKL